MPDYNYLKIEKDTLIECPACQNKCSREATACPRCGHPFRSQAETGRGFNPPLIYGGVAAVLVILLSTVGYLYFRSSANRSNAVVTAPASSNRAAGIQPRETPVPDAVVKLEAGIVYTYTGPQPVSRTEFYLLDTDLEKVLSEAGVQPQKQSSLTTEPISRVGFAYTYPDQDPGTLPKAMAGVKAHAKYSLTTDFQGKATLTHVQPGTYYIFGVTRTRKAFAIWNLKVDVKSGENSIALDTNNAAVAL